MNDTIEEETAGTVDIDETPMAVLYASQQAEVEKGTRCAGCRSMISAKNECTCGGAFRRPVSRLDVWLGTLRAHFVRVT